MNGVRHGQMHMDGAFIYGISTSQVSTGQHHAFAALEMRALCLRDVCFLGMVGHDRQRSTAGTLLTAACG